MASRSAKATHFRVLFQPREGALWRTLEQPNGAAITLSLYITRAEFTSFASRAGRYVLVPFDAAGVQRGEPPQPLDVPVDSGILVPSAAVESPAADIEYVVSDGVAAARTTAAAAATRAEATAVVSGRLTAPTRLRVSNDELVAKLRAHPPGTPLPNTLYERLRIRFGSLAAACAAAGVTPPTRRRTSNDELLARLRAHGSNSGLPAALRTGLIHRFGTMAAARAAAGVARPPPKRAPTEELLAALRARVVGQALPNALYKVLRRTFGSAAEAYAAAGVTPPSRRRISDRELLVRLRTHGGVGPLPGALYERLRFRFGSLAAAYAEAGLESRPSAAPASNYELLTKLRAHPIGMPLPRSFANLLRRRFGSVRAAHEVAGRAYVSGRHARARVTREDLLTQLRATPLGRGLPNSLRTKLRAVFGSLAAAYAAAGVPPRRPGPQPRRG